MAIEQGIWKLADSAGEPPRKLRPAGLADEGLLEEQIMQDVAILNRDWLLIGRQVRTAFDKLVDLLAIDANGTVIIIELKRDKTPRDVVAQAIDYASWVVTLADYQLIDIYQAFAERYGRPHATLGEAFEAKFGIPLDSVMLNESHQLVVVATRLDASSERIITYLNEHAQLSLKAEPSRPAAAGSGILGPACGALRPAAGPGRTMTAPPAGRCATPRAVAGSGTTQAVRQRACILLRPFCNTE